MASTLQDILSLIGNTLTPPELRSVFPEVQAELVQQEARSRKIPEGLISALIGAVGPGGSRLFGQALSKGSAPAKNIAQLAKKGTTPLSSSNKLFPALIDERTGEVVHSLRPGPFQHASLEAALPPSFRPTRGFVDPLTFNAFTERMLDELSKAGKF